MIEDLTTLKVGDKVGVISYSGHSQGGTYTVAKSDKVKCIIRRDGDNYERTFSSRTKVEKGSVQYRSALIVSMEYIQRITAHHEKQKKVDDAWANIRDAANRRNFASLVTAMTHLRSLSD